MIGDMLLWARRNSRQAVALALAPGLLMLGVDAAIAHFAGKDFENLLQFPPVIYGLVGFLVTIAVAVPKSRRVFGWGMRVLGVLGVVIGLLGTGFHIVGLVEALDGDYGWPNIQGTIGAAPPIFAPLAFTGLGSLLFLLPSSVFFVRLKLGSPKKNGRIVELSAEARANTRVG